LCGGAGGKSQNEDLDLPKINAELFAEISPDKDRPELDNAEAGIEACACARPDH
jgi:hypothetical protein